MDIGIIIPIVLIVAVMAFGLYKMNKTRKESMQRSYSYIRSSKDPTQRHPSSVVNGEDIILTIYGGNYGVKCMNNNPKEEKMYVRIIYESGGKKDEVYSYRDNVFKDFTTLNPVFLSLNNKTGGVGKIFEKELKAALKEERFEEASIIRDAIEKLKELKKNEKVQKKAD